MGAGVGVESGGRIRDRTIGVYIRMGLGWEESCGGGGSGGRRIRREEIMHFEMVLNVIWR